MPSTESRAVLVVVVALFYNNNNKRGLDEHEKAFN